MIGKGPGSIYGVGGNTVWLKDILAVYRPQEDSGELVVWWCWGKEILTVLCLPLLAGIIDTTCVCPNVGSILRWGRQNLSSPLPVPTFYQTLMTWKGQNPRTHMLWDFKNGKSRAQDFHSPVHLEVRILSGSAPLTSPFGFSKPLQSILFWSPKASNWLPCYLPSSQGQGGHTEQPNSGAEEERWGGHSFGKTHSDARELDGLKRPLHLLTSETEPRAMDSSILISY